MRFGERVAIFFVRPIYRTFFEKPLWWFVARVKTFFFAEIGLQLGNFERRFQTEDAVSDQRWAALERRLQSLEAANAAQWDALEQLLLALFRQPELRTLDPEWTVSSRQETSILNTSDGNGVHAANNIR